MKNIFSYFKHNKGLFNKYSDIYKKLKKICLEIDPSQIEKEYQTIIINKKIGTVDNVNDSYNEEIYDDEILHIKITSKYSLSLIKEYDHYVYINGDLMELNQSQTSELYNILLNKYTNKKKIEKEERIRRSFEKIR